MKKYPAAIVILLLAGPPLLAHPLDQYLELAQVAIKRDSITIEVRLIPGALVSAKVVELIDTDRDGNISLSEQRHYANALLSDLLLKVDGREVPLNITDIRFPQTPEIVDGSGFIDLYFTSSVDLSAAGKHDIEFSNNHLIGFGVTQVNALSPEVPGISILSQERDPNQRHLLLTISDGRLSLPSKLELGALAVVFLALIAFYLRKTYA